MIEQIGPAKADDELKDQAPRYAKLLPDLPRLLHDYLQQRPADNRSATLEALIAGTARTNRLLQGHDLWRHWFCLGLIACRSSCACGFFKILAH
jgi:ubiquinone biosynthesis protein